eukprot:PhM_4_TR7565/c2_g1_i1/m.18160/K00808/hss; homospermidine synthase
MPTLVRTCRSPRPRQSGPSSCTHLASRACTLPSATQVPISPKPVGVFCNTWSSDGFISEGMQPAELGWGTHEKWFPPTARHHTSGCKAAIYLERPGADTRVRTWVPSIGPQYGLLVTHNEAISIADYYTVDGRDESHPIFRPTCHYAYSPCEAAWASLREMMGSNSVQERLHVYSEDEIMLGVDELGVLLYGHKKNAYWFGSTLSHDEAKGLSLEQNCTGLQVTSGALAGIVWALENPNKGVTEADDIADYKRCLGIQRPYLGRVHGAYTEWTPLLGLSCEGKKTKSCAGLFGVPDRVNTEDPWQFSNVIVDV